MRARACIRCREYILLHPEVPNQMLERVFEKNHRGHNLVTLELDEVKDKYKIFSIKEEKE